MTWSLVSLAFCYYQELLVYFEGVKVYVSMSRYRCICIICFGLFSLGSGLDLNMYFKVIRHFTHPRSSVSVIIKLILICFVVAQVKDDENKF